MLDHTEPSTANPPAQAPAPRGRIAASSAGDLLRAMMILETPPKPWTLAGWYLKEIAGVPFILRNILTLQREGVRRLVIYHKADDADIDGLAEIFADPRVNMQIDLITDLNIIIETLKSGKSRFLFSGSALHWRPEVALALEKGFSSLSPEEGIYPLSVEKLENLIKSNQLETFDLKDVKLNSNFQKETETGLFIAGGERAGITMESDFHVQSERLFQTCGLSNDSFMDRMFTRGVSRQLTRFFVRTTMTPNQITGLSLALGLAAACLFFSGSYFTGVAGAGLLLLSAWVDCTDGEVARLKFQESKFGSSLDIFSDNIVHIAIFISMGMGLYFSTGNSVYRTMGLLAAMGSAVSFALMYSTITQEKFKASAGKAETAGAQEAGAGGIDLASHLANRDFIYLIFLLAVAGQLRIFIFITAIGSNVFASFLAYKKLRAYLLSDESNSKKTQKKGKNLL